MLSAVEIRLELADLGIMAFFPNLCDKHAALNQEANSNSEDGGNDETMVFITQSRVARQQCFMLERRVG